ncbi:MAG: hypothetical protein LBD77_05915, partial [Bifidobacteriaceae bacterium]|nr:hypothetical protein [Bifidobacteriaceae bacterium]
GLAQRLPEREVLALPVGVTLPKALSDWRSVTISLSAAGVHKSDGLSHWNANGLIAGIAIRPSGYRDLAGLAQWLPQSGGLVEADALAACLAHAPTSAWQRAAYLARWAGAEGVADRLMAERPPKTPVWFGATRSAGATHDPATKITDADLAPLMNTGVGA